MQTNILWSGREYRSLENCLVNYTETGVEISSTIVGHYQGKIYKVDYQILTNLKWETLVFEVQTQCNDSREFLRFEAMQHGGWLANGESTKLYNGCIDVDISLTPFTNSLPINRMQAALAQQQEITVIYIDVLHQRIKPVRQLYKKNSQSNYHFENVPNDFEADIAIDDSGLVVDYPGLFVREAILSSSYC
jgi:hypothetical protein